MELPDCPPGAEGYQDSVVGELGKKPDLEDCTKAEQEFQEHLNSLKIKLENGDARPMVERRGRDISGKWIYLCYPCAAMCSGESILQTHISGKKHKTKLALKNIWPQSIFDEHPFIVNEKGGLKPTSGATEKVLQKMAEEVDLYNKNPTELDLKYNKYRTVRCHIQDSIDAITAPLLGVEYLIEHPPEEAHYEPSYICVLCNKQGHPRTIINHMTCFWHRYNYLVRHYAKATHMLNPYRMQNKYREGVNLVMNRLAQRVEDKYGRMRPAHVDKLEYEKDKERIHQWIFKGYHFSEQEGPSFEEVVDVDLITTLHVSSENSKQAFNKRDPSPPIVAAPSKPKFNAFTRSAGRQERRAGSVGGLSDISDEIAPRHAVRDARDSRNPPRNRNERPKERFEPYYDKRAESFRTRYALKNAVDTEKDKDKRPPNYEYKIKLADDRRKVAEDSAKKTLAYHEKNPEKHPLYPEEWKKFWNRRYKEIQAEGKDPSKHDFKPEWIVFWTQRMKELHEQELRINVVEIYRRLCLVPPEIPTRDSKRQSMERRMSPDRRKSAERRRSVDRRRSAERHDRRRTPEPRRRSPEHKRRSPEPKRRSPVPKRRSPEPKRRSPEPKRRSPEPKHRSREPRRSRSPGYRRERERRTPDFRRSPGRRHSPPRPLGHRSRSPLPLPRARSPARTHITLESARRSRDRSPLSRRDEASRNRSPHHAPCLQTVMISDDELKPDDGLSPWNSDNDLDSLGSLPDARSPVRIRSRSRTGSVMSSHTTRSRFTYPGKGAEPQDLGPAENIVATLRLLVALEDYLGSLGPKVVDLLTEALRMEKERANASEELLERESAVALIETSKERLKGAVQAGLVPHAAAAAVRTAVVRAASTLHEADTRTKRKQQNAGSKSSAPVPVAGVGAVDRAQIAQQMAAALIAQGKTDVSAEELAQLVDAVVGMAEAKKREAEVKKKVEARAESDRASRPLPAAVCGTASALQMLQSAYDENDKKCEVKEDAPDAMDGLSDSDLETLLKNFNELSAEEQHSLIAYLKKLEAKEPQRVERLRQYVTSAATATPHEAAAAAAPPQKKDERKTVTIESDDDDYTVEEVFQSATKKVKEDQIRQEMEIVKKSLEKSMEASKQPPPKAVSPKETPIVDLTKTSSSASNLLALVQASIQSTSAGKNQVHHNAEVVSSGAQPRSFGDLPEALLKNEQSSNKKPLIHILGNLGGYRERNEEQQITEHVHFGGNQNYGGIQVRESPGQFGGNQGFGNQAQENTGQFGGNQGFGNQGQENIEQFENQDFGSQEDNMGQFGNQDNTGQFGNQDFENQGDNMGQFGNQDFGSQADNMGQFGNRDIGSQEGNMGQFGNQDIVSQGDNMGQFGGNQDFGSQGDNMGRFGENQSFGNQPRNMGQFGENQVFRNQPQESLLGQFGANQRFGNQNQDNVGQFGGNPGFGNQVRDNNFGGNPGFGKHCSDTQGQYGGNPGSDVQRQYGNDKGFGINQNQTGGNQGPIGGNQGQIGGNKGRFGGNQNFNPRPWERPPMGNNMRGNNKPRGKFTNARTQDNYDTRPAMNQQFRGQGNFRGRGGRGNRGRGRGH